ncbi:dopa decarboxylase-like protein [Rhizodiscina lignyota]|uniref:Dopa decarboxylase-like protein n=1 Tax=Rhizodiscina lignyota TaxID=1504668 RepID=A0A9P4IP30_9PEZI|nr:dopa decarboxylase-like protein [Rhizodiscina lignyota]
MDSQQFREAAHAAVEEIIQYYETLPSRRVVSSVSPGYLAPQLPTSAPSESQPWTSIQPDIEKLIMPGLTHWQHPGFMAFFPSNTTYPSMLGELYSAAFSAPAFNWLCSPAVTELETVMMDWVGQMVGLPDVFLSKGQGGGVIQGSASEAIVCAMVAARERIVARKCEQEGLKGGTRERERREGLIRAELVALGSDQAHSSTQKGAIVAGTCFRTVATKKEDDFAMRGASLKQTIEDCRREGLEPYYLTTTLGTTSTCAVDIFDEIAEVCKEYPDIWVHVDAAYAGSALICEEYQHYSKSFAQFDSFDFNLHKWLLTNFDASCLYVRSRADLTAALSITPSYLRNAFSDSGLVTDYRDWQIPLGRRFRSLKIWFVLRSYGIQRLQAVVRGHIKLGETFADLIRSRGDLFEIFTTPVFALTVFTVRPPMAQRSRDTKAIASPADRPDPTHEDYTNDFTPDAQAQYLFNANRITKDVYETVNNEGEVFLTSSMVKGTYVIRVVSASERSNEEWIRKAFDILVRTTELVFQRENKVQPQL